MAAFGTKKYGGDKAVQLTFPAIFQENFSKGFGYYPQAQPPPIQLMIGTNFQSEYHEEKRRASNKNVMDGLQARKSAERLLLTGTANYHLPKPVLGQRKFANPSFGMVGDYSARRDTIDAPWITVRSGDQRGLGPLRGGVLKTAEGFDFYNQQLRDRVEQLDRINAVSLGYTVTQGQNAPTSDNTKEGSTSKVNFFISLRALSDSVSENKLSNFTFTELKELLKMLFDFAPVATLEDLNDTLVLIQEIVFETNALDDYNNELAEETAGEERGNNPEYVMTLRLFTDGMLTYTKQMIRNVNLSEKDKRTLSKSLVKSLGFESLLPKKSPQAVIDLARRTNPRLNQDAEDADADDRDDDDDDDDGKFDRPPIDREDEEAGGAPRAPLAGANGDPNREVHGRRGRRIPEPPAFFEDERRDDAPADVAPLDVAGADPNAQIPEADVGGLREDLDAGIQRAKYALIADLTPEDADKDLEQLLQDKNIDPRDFIRNLEETLLNRGLSKPDIATAMQLSGLPMFTQYIADNLAEGRVPPPQRVQRPAGVDAPLVRWEPAAAPAAAAPAPFSSADRFRLIQAIGSADTKDELKAIWDSLPVDRKLGVARPHGNASVATWRRKLMPLIQ